MLHSKLLYITGLAELPCTTICSEATSAWKMTGKNTSRIHLNVSSFSLHSILSPPPFSIPSFFFYANTDCKRLVWVFDFWFLCLCVLCWYIQVRAARGVEADYFFKYWGVFKQMLNPLWTVLYAFSSSPKDLWKAGSSQRRGKNSVQMKQNFK